MQVFVRIYFFKTSKEENMAVFNNTYKKICSKVPISWLNSFENKHIQHTLYEKESMICGANIKVAINRRKIY